MHCALKTLLLWLVIAALPLQGLAAVTKAACGPAHHALSSAAMMAGQHAHAHVDVHEGAFDQHDMAGHHHAEATVASHDAGDAAPSSDNASAYCAACAACCVGAVAPPSATLPTPEPTASKAIILSPASLLAGHVPSAPERPPRFAA